MKQNIYIPNPAPASNRNEPHSQATWRGLGSAQTINVNIASSPFRTDTVCEDGCERNTCGAPNYAQIGENIKFFFLTLVFNLN